MSPFETKHTIDLHLSAKAPKASSACQSWCCTLRDAGWPLPFRRKGHALGGVDYERGERRGGVGGKVSEPNELSSIYSYDGSILYGSILIFLNLFLTNMFTNNKYIQYRCLLIRRD